ncbi:hypothetical protein NXS98_04120 [Fontisphaera persica]|uniref:hypothetical protein n=1 Tax=Fontisphaera persica TaxID=2974023 RepID=UPI0024BFEBCA|nr:hypothetical protein [Fontisphaera persica]WCJ61284.1 hypothetical protein NXS98_04120 [Fontisphaera persica]
MSKAKAPEVAARKAARERIERRKSVWMIVGIALLMVGAVVADMFFIGWQRHQRHLRHQRSESRTNHIRSGVQPDGSVRTEAKP